MDTHSRSDVIEGARGRKMGVAGGRSCAECGVIVHWRIEKYCQSKRARFGSRIYCLRCQKSFPEVPREISS